MMQKLGSEQRKGLQSELTHGVFLCYMIDPMFLHSLPFRKKEVEMGTDVGIILWENIFPCNVISFKTDDLKLHRFLLNTKFQCPQQPGVLGSKSVLWHHPPKPCFASGILFLTQKL